MRQSRLIMGMPVIVELVGETARSSDLDSIFAYFTQVDERFSTYKETSEISAFNRGEVSEPDYSDELREVFRLSEETKRESGGYFDIRTPSGLIDPSGLVKGWAIQQAAVLAASLGYENFYIEAGGDIQTRGTNAEGGGWSIGIRNPHNRDELIAVVYPHGNGIATSGTAVRGEHLYNPLAPDRALNEFLSLTVIGPNVYEADRFATIAFVMGQAGLELLEKRPGFEAFAVRSDDRILTTSGWERYTAIR